MAQTTLRSVALQFMQDWEAGKQPSLQDYVSRYPGYARELMEFVADYMVFEAVAPMPTSSGSVRG